MTETRVPHMCLLHGDFHQMEFECWATTVDWYMEHEHEPEGARRDAYQWEVEQRMLTALLSP